MYCAEPIQYKERVYYSYSLYLIDREYYRLEVILNLTII